MEEIRLSQTQTPSSTGSVAGHVSSDDPVLAPTAINESVIDGQVLEVWRGYRNGVERIIKGRRKAPDTPRSLIVIGLSEQSAQAIKEHRLLREQVYALQHELEAYKSFITQTIGPPPPHPPPPLLPLLSSDDAEDLHRD